MATEGFKREIKEIEKKGGKEEEEKGRKNLMHTLDSYTKPTRQQKALKGKERKLKKRGERRRRKGKKKPLRRMIINTPQSGQFSGSIKG